MAKIESIVEPNSVTNDSWRKSVPFICVHEPVLPIFGGLLGKTVGGCVDSVGSKLKNGNGIF
jgi:hypothetical protein